MELREIVEKLSEDIANESPREAVKRIGLVEEILKKAERKQRQLEELAEASALVSESLSAMREKLIADGFTREEAMELVKITLKQGG